VFFFSGEISCVFIGILGLMTDVIEIGNIEVDIK